MQEFRYCELHVLHDLIYLSEKSLKMKLIGTKVLHILLCLCITTCFIHGVYAMEHNPSPIESGNEQIITTDDLWYYGEPELHIAQIYDGSVTPKTDRAEIEKAYVQTLFSTDPSLHTDIAKAYYNAGKLGIPSSETHTVHMGDRLTVIFYPDGSLSEFRCWSNSTPTESLSTTLNSASSWVYTDTYTIEHVIRSVVQLEVGRLVLSGYFLDNGVNAPYGVITEHRGNVDPLSVMTETTDNVRYPNTCNTKLSMTVKGSLRLSLGEIGNREWYLWINSDKDGHVTKGWERY